MKRLPELARRGAALVLAASMSLSILMPSALAANISEENTPPRIESENSVDELGNEDLSDETFNVPEEDTETAAPAADHTWGEWTEGETEDGQPVKLRICEDCGAVELEDGTIIGYINMGDEPELADDDQPEWYPSDFIAPLGMDDSDYALTTQGLNADGKTWNYEADYSKWTYNTSTQYLHGTNDMGNNHHSLPIYTWTSKSNGKNKAVTCTEDGYIGHNCDISQKIGWITIVCQSEWQETIAAPGKHLKNLYEVKATCTTDGVKYYYCGRDNGAGNKDSKGNGNICYYIWDDPAPVITLATGHHTGGKDDEHKWEKGDNSEVGWVIEEATCTTAGKRYRKCDTCGAEEVDDKYAKEHPATGHKTADGKVWYENDAATAEDGWTTDKKATCGTAGSRHRTCVNENCTLENHTETEEIQPTGKHTYKEFVSTTQKYPCTAGKETWKCTVCGATEERDAKVADHSFGLWTDDDVLGCQTQKQTRVCLVCGYEEHRDSSGPVRGHKYTKYIMKTATEWATVNIPVDIPSWAVDPLKALGVRFDDENKHIQIADNMPVPIVIAYCDYGCETYDKLIATEFPEYAAEAWAATEASKSVANTAEPLIREALADTKTAVNNAKNREEAIAALDQIYEVAKAKLLANGNVPVKVDLRVTGTWPSNYPFIGGKQWTVKLYEGTINVPITEEVADQALAQLKNVLDDTKNMLSSSFLSEDAIKVAINKIVDTVAGDTGLNESIRQLAFYPIYNSINTRKQDQWPNQATDSTATETGELILRLAESAVTDKEGWQPFLDAIFDDLIDMLIEQLKKDPEYSKYLDNALGDELLEELRPKLRDELVNDTTFVDNIREIAGKAIQNAAYGVKRGWSDDRVLSQLREDLMKVQDPVEQEMLDLSTKIGDMVGESLRNKINNFLPFGDLTSWIGNWIGAFAKDKTVEEVAGETGKVRDTIELYIKYITCGQHDRHDRISQNASCTEPEITENYCSKCGWVFSKTKTGEPLGHTPVTIPGYDATETTDGLTDGIQCTTCGKWIEPQEVIPALTPEYDKWLVQANITADTVKATGYKDQKSLDAAIDAALTKAGFTAADSERFLAQAQTNLDVLQSELERDPGQGASRILPNDRYPEDGITGMVKIPAQAAGKNCTFYAVQVLTADSHGYSAGDVVITPLTVTKEGISLKLPVQSVVAIAWKVNE